MKNPSTYLTVCALALFAGAASALPGTFMIDEIYSNASGSVQFVVIRDHGQTDCDAGENLWAGQRLLGLGPAPTRTFVFPTNLPTCATSGRHILIGTQSFAALGLVTPDYVVPDGFLQIPSGGVGFADISHLSYTNLPSDGIHAIDTFGATIDNVATNLAGASASVPVVTAFAINPGTTGAWYDPQQSGHGLFLEVLPQNQLLAFWFTFTPDGTQQSWFGGVGPYAGSTATVPVTLTTGGRWIPNFDASKIVNNPWGTLTFTFTDCNTGRVDFVSSYPGYGSNHMNLARLTAPAGLTCP